MRMQILMGIAMKHRLCVLAIVMTLIAASLFAWERIYFGPDHEEFETITSAWDGGYFLAGSTRPSFTSPSGDLLFAKVDIDGNILWSVTYGDPIPRESYAHHVRSADSAYVSVMTIDFPMHHLGLLKLDMFGDTLWFKDYRLSYDCAAFDIIKTQNNGFAITGWIETTSLPANAQDFLIVLADSLGDTTWTRSYGNDSTSTAYCIRQTLDGDFLLCGVTYKDTLPYDSDVYVMRISQAGDSIWARTYDFSDSGYFDGAHDMFFVNGDTAIITGTADWDVTSDHSQLFVMCIDEIGNLLWYNTIDPLSSYGSGVAIVPSEDGGFVVLGTIFSATTMTNDIWLLKFDSSGDTVWTRKFGVGTDKSEHSNDIIATPDGGYIIAGSRVYHDTDDADPYIIKVDSLGYSPVEESPRSKGLKPLVYSFSAWPNPFNGNCRFQIDDLGMGIDAIEIYDVNGRRIDVIARSPQDDAAISQINRSSVSLDTRRDAVSINNYVFVWQPAPSLGSGVYLIRIKTGGETATRRVVYLK